MNTVTKMGIWMDHQRANAIEFTVKSMETRIIHSQFNNASRDGNFYRAKDSRYTAIKNQKTEFYNALGTIVHQYESVILFGPTNAKTELYNMLAADGHFSNTVIQVKQTDIMTEDQQHTFVREFFMPSIIQANPGI